MLDLEGTGSEAVLVFVCISFVTLTSGKYQLGYKPNGELRHSTGFCHFLTLVEQG